MMSWASDVAGHHADVHAAISPNRRILEDIGESRRDGGRILRVVQRRARRQTLRVTPAMEAKSADHLIEHRENRRPLGHA